MRGQIQAAEVPHQVPEDDRVLTEELVSVDDLDENTQVQPFMIRSSVFVFLPFEHLQQKVSYLIALVLQQGLQLLAQHQGAEVRDRHRLGVWPFCTHTILQKKRNL